MTILGIRTFFVEILKSKETDLDFKVLIYDLLSKATKDKCFTRIFINKYGLEVFEMVIFDLNEINSNSMIKKKVKLCLKNISSTYRSFPLLYRDSFLNMLKYMLESCENEDRIVLNTISGFVRTCKHDDEYLKSLDESFVKLLFERAYTRLRSDSLIHILYWLSICRMFIISAHSCKVLDCIGYDIVNDILKSQTQNLDSNEELLKVCFSFISELLVSMIERGMNREYIRNLIIETDFVFQTLNLFLDETYQMKVQILDVLYTLSRILREYDFNINFYLNRRYISDLLFLISHGNEKAVFLLEFLIDYAVESNNFNTFAENDCLNEIMTCIQDNNQPGSRMRLDRISNVLYKFTES